MKFRIWIDHEVLSGFRYISSKSPPINNKIVSILNTGIHIYPAGVCGQISSSI